MSRPVRTQRKDSPASVLIVGILAVLLLLPAVFAAVSVGWVFSLSLGFGLVALAGFVRTSTDLRIVRLIVGGLGAFSVGIGIFQLIT